MPSHQTPSVVLGVRATLVKMVLRESVAMALGLVLAEVAGRDAKEARLGIDGAELAAGVGAIQAMSSPTVQTFQPSKPFGGTIMAKLVLPQALGEGCGDVGLFGLSFRRWAGFQGQR